MKKVLGLVVLSVLFVAVPVFAEGWTPVRVSLVPGLALPPIDTTKGLDIGLIATKLDVVWGVDYTFIWSRVDKEMYGIQAAWIGCRAGKMYGLQSSWTNKVEELRGWQSGIVNRANEAKWLQTALVYNKAEKMIGLQFGLVNYAASLTGVQLGLINITKSSSISPVLPIFNAAF